MRFIPAIDLMDGKCVRLVQGQRDKITFYPASPIEIAQEYSDLGAGLIHVVDLDGAFTGEMKNSAIVKELAKKFPIQVGGGIRSEQKILELLEFGALKVVVSTMLLKDQKLASKIKSRYSSKLLGSFDFKDGKLSYAGWTKQSEISFEEASDGLAEIIVTDTTRDGTLTGPNLELLRSIKKVYTDKITAAGGIRNLKDIVVLEKLSIDGVIIGKALLDNKIKFENFKRWLI